jgi:hypothetical protein
MSDLITKESILFDTDKVAGLFKTCQSLAKTPFLKQELRGKPEAVLSIILMARELNIPPMTALTKMHFIQGQPTLPAQMMLALAKKSNPEIDYRSTTDNVKNSVTVQAINKSDGSLICESIWDMARAKQLGVAGRDQYIKQPLVMLKWRAVTEVIRFACPEAVNGIYGYEEMTKLDGTDIEEIPASDIEEDFPIPKEETKVGNFYRIQNGKHRGAQLKDFSEEELEEYKAFLEKQILSKNKKPWHDELQSVIAVYLCDFAHYRRLLVDDIELESEE